MKPLILFLIPLLMFLSGCGSEEKPPAPANNVSKVYFDAIRVGMTKADVIEILGPGMPADTDDAKKAGSAKVGVERRQWKKDGQSIEVSFVADKVVAINSSGL